MNIRVLMSPTPEGRIAAVMMRVLRHCASLYGRGRVMEHVDHKDFQDELREELREAIGRELLLAKLNGLGVPAADREKVKREIVIELSKVFHDEAAKSE